MISTYIRRMARLILICANRFRQGPNPNFRQGTWSKPVSFGVLEGLDYCYLACPLGEGPLIRPFTGDSKPLIDSPKWVLSGCPSRGELVGLYSWHAKIVSANQD